jgi:bla regulator protein BlaR1
MEAIYQILPGETIYALGWTVIHSLWQALVLAFLLLLVLSGLSRKKSSWRYLSANLALILQLVVSGITFFVIKQQSPVTKSLPHPPILEEEVGRHFAEAVVTSPLEQIQNMFVAYFEAHLPLIVLIWLIGTAFFLLRLLGGLVYVQHLRYHQVYPLQEEWQAFIEHLQTKLNYKQKVALLSSAAVKVPMVIGYFKPVILVPAGVLTLLTPAELEAVIAHELAHIYRKDFVFNILQTFIESLFYFNPAVWWISAYIRTERENCCDDIAVTISGHRLSYVKALVKLEEANQASPRMAMAFAKRGKGHLLLRVKRILNQPQNKSSMMEKFSASILLIAALICWSLSMSSSNDKAIHPINGTLDAFDKLVQQKRSILISRIALDTLPKGDISIQSEKDGKQISAILKDGKIKSIVVDGKQIPVSDFVEYEQTIESLLSNLPEPPAIPILPELPEVPEIPAPPTPPAPPAPPAPEMPEAPEMGGLSPRPAADATVPRQKTANIVVEVDAEGEEYTVIVTESVDVEASTFEFEDIENGEKIHFGEADLQWQSDNNDLVFVWSDGDKKRIVKGLRGAEKQLKEMEKHGLLDADHILEHAELSLENALDKKIVIDGITVLGDGPSADFEDWDGGGFAFFQKQDLSDILSRELKKDGLIRKNGGYKLEVNDKGKLKVNGKKQPEAITKKYIGLIERITGNPVKGDHKVIIQKK